MIREHLAHENVLYSLATKYEFEKLCVKESGLVEWPWGSPEGWAGLDTSPTNR